MTKPDPPSPGTAEYLWWSQGARDEAAARDEGLSAEARHLRDALEGFARGYGPSATLSGLLTGLLTGLMSIYCPDRLRRRFRRFQMY